MKKYVELELEVKNIKIDILTTSPNDTGHDTPGVDVEDDMLG